MQSMQPGSQVVLQIDYVMQLKTKQRPGFGHTFALQVPLPAGTSKDARSLSGSGPAVSVELVGESMELEVDVAATTPGVVVERCPTGVPNCYKVESPVLQDVALEIAMPKRGQTQAESIQSFDASSHLAEAPRHRPGCCSAVAATGSRSRRGFNV